MQIGRDGGPATRASFFPEFTTLDSEGNLYIDDIANSRIRRIDAKSGIITTMAGSNRRHSRGDGGQATNAGLYYPDSIAIGANGDLFITQGDTHGHAIRRVDEHTGLISTLSGSAFTGGKPLGDVLPLPRLLFSDARGNLYVLDKARVHYIDLSRHVISTIAGTTAGFSGDGGPAVKAQLYYPNSLAFDSKGNLYLADSSNNRIRRIDASTGIITTVAGNGKGPPPYTGGVITLQQ